jgi:transcription termination/antitermination protein NusG
MKSKTVKPKKKAAAAKPKVKAAPAPLKIKVEGKHEWFIVNAYSGHEKRVANQVIQRTKANNLEDYITEVLVPTQNKIVVSEGKKRTVEEKIFPGYVLVKMIMNDKTWQIIRNTEGVTGFVGTERKPTPLSPEEVKSIMAFMKVEQPSYQASFAVDDAVKVTDGPFKDFVGTISEINEDKGQVKVLLSVFGRETPVVLDFLQVTRL